MRANAIEERPIIPTFPPTGPVVIASRAPDVRVMRFFNPLMRAPCGVVRRSRCSSAARR